jgi:hypothetical protein
MPPTDFCKLRYFDVRARTATLVSSLGRWPRPPSGSYAQAPFSLAGAAARGEPCIRPVSTTPLPVPPACAGLPDLDTA